MAVAERIAVDDEAAAQARTTALAKIHSFNQKYPEIAIGMANLQASLRQRARSAAQSDHGINVGRKLAARVRAEVEGARPD